MKSGDIYTFTISKQIKGEPTIIKDYCYLNPFDAKIQSSVLFLISAEKDKGKKEDNEYIIRLKKELKTDLEYFTDKSKLLSYLNTYVAVKDFYGNKSMYYKLSKK